MWTDEKIFTTNGMLNLQNDIIWAESREAANANGGLFEEEKYPTSVMVSIGVTWNGLTEPYFFDKGIRLNTQRYISVLQFFKREGDRLFGHTKWGFQQDGASAHTSNKSQLWCENHFEWYVPKNRWPPNSPELNPVDYSVWNEITTHMDFKKLKSQADLIKEIKNATKKIDMKFCREVIGQFLKRVYAVEKNNGNLIIDDIS
jgi:hypothetical protein